jgi:hypothetical protein
LLLSYASALFESICGCEKKAKTLDPSFHLDNDLRCVLLHMYSSPIYAIFSYVFYALLISMLWYSSPIYAIFSYVFYALLLCCGGFDYLHLLYTSFWGISFGMCFVTNAYGVGEAFFDYP